MVEIWLGGRFGYMAGEYFVTTVRTAGFVEISCILLRYTIFDDNLFKLIEMSL